MLGSWEGGGYELFGIVTSFAGNISALYPKLLQEETLMSGMVLLTGLQIVVRGYRFALDPSNPLVTGGRQVTFEITQRLTVWPCLSGQLLLLCSGFPSLPEAVEYGISLFAVIGLIGLIGFFLAILF